MERRLMCDECLKTVAYKLRREEIIILEYLKKNKVFNQHLAVDKEKIINNSKCGLTVFKINVSLARLEIVNILDVIIAGRNKKYFITDDGLRLLELYTKDLMEKAKSIK